MKSRFNFKVPLIRKSKTMKSKYLLVLILCLSGFGLQAENPKLKTPGFLGLRASLKYDFGAMVNWDFMAKMPYMHHSAEFGYALTRRHELVLRYSRMDYQGSSKIFGYNGYNGLLVNGISGQKNQLYASNEASVICKFYRNRKGYIAPVGRYFLLGIGYIHSVHTLKLIAENYEDPDILYTKRITSHDMVLKVGMGRNFIVAKRLIISIEGLVNLPVTSIFKMLPSSFVNDKYGSETELVNQVSTNIFLKQLVEFKIGFGSLIF